MPAEVTIKINTIVSDYIAPALKKFRNFASPDNDFGNEVLMTNLVFPWLR